MKLSELSPSDLRGRLAGRGLYLRTGPFVTAIRSRLDTLAQGLSILYSDFPLADEGFADFHVRYDRPGNLRRWFRAQAWFYFDGATPFKPLPVMQVLPMFEWTLNWCIAANTQQFLAVHAAVLERDGKAIVFPGPPGAGKSTLCAALSRRGWRLLSDELCLLRDDRTVMGLARPISLKNESIDIVRGFETGVVIGPACTDTHKGRVAHLKPTADAVARVDEPAMPAWVVLPQYERDAPPTLSPLPRTVAFMRMADNSFNYSTWAERGFETIAALIDRCDCYRFKYSSLVDAVHAFERVAAGNPPVTGEMPDVTESATTLLRTREGAGA